MAPGNAGSSETMDYTSPKLKFPNTSGQSYHIKKSVENLSENFAVIRSLSLAEAKHPEILQGYHTT